MRLFLDANVIFTAAHNPNGRSSALFALASVGACALLTSAHTAEEARRNIRLKYPSMLGRLDELMQVVTLQPEAAPSDVAWALDQKLPPNDAPVLAVAVRSGADVLVTGDRIHFGHLFGRRVRGLRVMTPAEALAEIVG
jgi:predicted nucleic acid-binding protein